MAIIRTLPAVQATAGTPTPVYTGTVTAAVSFSISGGLATIVLSAGSPPVAPPFYNQWGQATLWGFTTATYFNGETVTIVSSNPAALSFSFHTTHADVASTNDAGSTAPAPTNTYRGVRIEADQGNSTHKIYVGDQSVTSSQYVACLTLTGQLFVEFHPFASQNIAANRIFIDTDSTGAKVQVTLIP
jgi:hypothetical protein